MNQLRFLNQRDLREYLLVRWPNTVPWPPSEQLQQVERPHDLRVVIAAATDGSGRWNRQLLHFLEIDEHPANMSGAQLARRIERQLRRAPAVKLYEQRPPPVMRIPVSLPPAAPPTPPAPLPPPQVDWVSVQLVTEDGTPLPNHRFALELPDGAVQTPVTNHEGVLYVDAIPSGNCTLQHSAPNREG